MSGEASAALTLDDVVCGFGTRVVVDRVTLHAPRGQVTALVGPSGCGKTTLLRLIAGIERPQGGRISIDGEEVAGPAAFVPSERRRVGLMFQDYALFPHLSLSENVRFGLGHRPRAEHGRIVEEALARVGLTQFAERRPGALSGGEQQRLALARALAPSPRILLMDEPFSNLDRGLREEVRAGTLALLREAGVTTLVVTHDPEEAMAIGDHLVLLGGGRVIQAGAASDVYARPATLSAARALSHINLVPAQVRDGALRTPLGPVAWAGHGEGTRGVAGFRPEQIALAPPGEGAPARIDHRSFRGASALLTVSVTGLSEPLRISVPADRMPGGTNAAVRAGQPAVFAPGE